MVSAGKYVGVFPCKNNRGMLWVGSYKVSCSRLVQNWSKCSPSPFLRRPTDGGDGWDNVEAEGGTRLAGGR